MQTTDRPIGRLQSIDLLRGVAAVAVVLYHFRSYAPSRGTLTEHLLLDGFWPGWSGVYLFFVISGFCIHLRWARDRAAGKEPVLDFREFWWRRLRRLWPPYVAALALYTALELWLGIRSLNRNLAVHLFLHLGMLHNLDLRTSYSIAGVFWTLAVEEQLYLAYFLLLRWRERLGWARTLFVCAAVRFAWLGIGWVAGRFYSSFPTHEFFAGHWITWALGAVSVEAWFGLVKLPAWARDFRWSILSLAVAGTLSGALSRPVSGWIAYPFWAVGYFVLLNAAVTCEREWRARPRAWLRAGVAVGTISYSLYLTHNLWIELLAPSLLAHLGIPQRLSFLFPGLTMVLLIGVGFYFVVERRFLNPPHLTV